MVHWYFDERVAVEQMREAQRRADRAQALGLLQAGSPERESLRTRLGRALVTIGNRLQRARLVHRSEVTASSQCGLR